MRLWLTFMTEASRAKHKFAVKRNSWPKTRGVAMNPVDHVRSFSFSLITMLITVASLTEVGIINILGKRRRYHDTLHKDKRLVLLLLAEPVYCVERRRQRSNLPLEILYSPGKSKGYVATNGSVFPSFGLCLKVLIMSYYLSEILVNYRSHRLSDQREETDRKCKHARLTNRNN